MCPSPREAYLSGVPDIGAYRVGKDTDMKAEAYEQAADVTSTSAPQPKKPYEKPRLIVHGDVTEITKGCDVGNADSCISGGVGSELGGILD